MTDQRISFELPEMTTPLEVSASLANLISVWLAAKNRSLTWPIGIAACLLMAVMFFEARLYADVALQGFFILTSLWGWWHWQRGQKGSPAAIRRTRGLHILLILLVASLTAWAYALMLDRWTNAAAPHIDSMVLSLSVAAQILLMRRRLETWYFWWLVNTLAVPLFWSRGLYLTAGVYSLFWVNAIYGYLTWRREMAAT